MSALPILNDGPVCYYAESLHEHKEILKSAVYRTLRFLVDKF